MALSQSAIDFVTKLAYTAPMPAGPPAVAAPVTQVAATKPKATPRPGGLAKATTTASTGGLSGTAKTANINSPQPLGVKQAPSHIRRAKAGKKLMPLPFERRTKAAEDLHCQFAAALARRPVEKQALGIGTAAGSALGAALSPSDRMGGLGHGAARGIGWDVGSSIGGTAGAVGGGALGLLLGALANRNNAGKPMGEIVGNKSLEPILAGLGIGGGAAMGYGAGGYLGQKLMGKITGPAPWQQQENGLTEGERQINKAQIAAP